MLFISFLTVKAQNIEVVIKGIISTQGQISIGIFKDNESFQDEKPFISKKFKKSNISNGEMRVTFNLEPGIYGFSLLDDENNDSKMNYSFFGIPEEGFGFSNYYHTELTKPKFDLFKFVVSKNQKRKIYIKIRYI
ncbi:MAG: DUF2141 domain-containing protein [Bacteroidia bacterium]|nr:DUF2141 domain-containing protein [Bacteroidia bacterium]